MKANDYVKAVNWRLSEAQMRQLARQLVIGYLKKVYLANGLKEDRTDTSGLPRMLLSEMKQIRSRVKVEDGAVITDMYIPENIDLFNETLALLWEMRLRRIEFSRANIGKYIFKGLAHSIYESLPYRGGYSKDEGTRKYKIVSQANIAENEAESQEEYLRQGELYRDGILSRLSNHMTSTQIYYLHMLSEGFKPAEIAAITGEERKAVINACAYACTKAKALIKKYNIL